MELAELFLLAIEALRRNVGRTLLTMLGIIIGIASVITIMSLGKGSTKSIVDSISAFGANVLTVSPGKARRGPGGESSTVTTLVSDDAKEIEKLSNVEAVSRVVSKSKTITANSESENVLVRGVDAVYSEIQSLEFLSGGFFSDGDVSSAAKDVALGDEVVEELYGIGAEEFVIGETIRIDNRVFQVVGVIKESGEAVVPVTTASSILFGQTHLDSISVKMIETDLSSILETEIENLLLDQHDIDEVAAADFNIRNSQSMVDTISSVTGTLTALLSGIAAISLVVGGIGIMNIMLVTVTERTREIGLLKALGAKYRDVLSQFLIEAVVLTILGGLIGMTLGILVALVASRAMSIPFVVTLSSIGLSVGVSVGVGVLFGWYPAKKAAKLHPIDALRYE
jgi:putative ABC transport system permease protein